MGSIDHPKNMQNSRVWLFSGQKDTVVDTGNVACSLLDHSERSLVFLPPRRVVHHAGVVKKAKLYYDYYIANASSVVMVTNISSEHAWITNRCATYLSPSPSPPARSSSANKALIVVCCMHVALCACVCALRLISYGNACAYLGEPYINNCNFDASGAMLRHFYPQSLVNPRAASINTANVRLACTLSLSLCVCVCVLQFALSM
jgi:hypothetical protein